MAINRVQVVWTGGLVQGNGLTTFYFDSAAGTAAQQVAAVAAFLDATEDRRNTGTAWSTNADVATLNEQTGTLEAITSTTPEVGVGTQSTDPMGPATQGLLRLITSEIVNGRLLRGRIFLPSAMESDNTVGAPSTTYKTDYDTAAAALIADSNTNWVVWSRTHGMESGVDTATTWSKWAVLRSRRD